MSPFKPANKYTKYVIDRNAIDKAKKILGLKCNITITAASMGSNWGQYYPMHRIQYSHSLAKKPYELTYTLWHELTHAKQCEIDYGDADTFINCTSSYYNQFYDGENPLWDPKEETHDEWLIRYLSIPHEAEAEAIAQRYSSRIPLVRIRPNY